MKNWKIFYLGWTITHDPFGKLACYRNDGDSLEWCYFGDTLREIKSEIYARNFFESIERVSKRYEKF